MSSPLKKITTTFAAQPTRSFVLLSVLLVSVATFAIGAILPDTVHSQTASEIQQKIDQRNSNIADLEKEIASYQSQIDSLGTQVVSLKDALKTLDLTRKKLEANISLTKDKISAKSYEVSMLGQQIDSKAGDISDNRRFISKAFITMNELGGSSSIVGIVLGSDSISKALDSYEQLNNLQDGLYSNIQLLSKDKSNLEKNKRTSESAKADLIKLNQQLNDQRSLVLTTQSEQTSLLKETNQSETSYKKILASKKAQEAAFQQEIEDYESQLHLLVNPSLIPHTGSGVLSWPLSKIVITQYFGNTPFSTANPQIYNGKGHTGVDFGASIGTPVKAALSGTIVGMGNTDLFPRCLSFGKWIMIKHDNGLSTLYAHLSLQSVAMGDTVTTGQMIGYSGNTGYTTGPHLHFGVYATQGVEIKRFDTSVNCKGATIPIADFKAYLNPLSFL